MAYNFSHASIKEYSVYSPVLSKQGRKCHCTADVCQPNFQLQEEMLHQCHVELISQSTSCVYYKE